MARMDAEAGKAGKRDGGVSWTRRGITFVVMVVVLWIMFLTLTGRVASYRAASNSMEPAIHTGETWLMEPPSGGEYRVGDIVVFDHADNASRRLAKRIVAIGPAEVSLKKGHLYVDGQASPPPQGNEEPVDLPDATWQVTRGEVFVAGDNRKDSLDSRDYGPISMSALRGVLVHKL